MRGANCQAMQEVLPDEQQFASDFSVSAFGNAISIIFTTFLRSCSFVRFEDIFSFVYCEGHIRAGFFLTRSVDFRVEEVIFCVCFRFPKSPILVSQTGKSSLARMIQRDQF